jgi:CubicO group peptidase (beta-lactamase class C family)
MSKIILRTIFIVLIASLGYGIYYAWNAFPIISSYSAKTMCSCVMLNGRQPDDITKNELSTFPLSLVSVSSSYTDSSATGSVFGFAKRKAIYRKGLGCTLINEITEEELRAQQFSLATPPAIHTDTIPWPMGDLIPEYSPSAIDIEKINATVEAAFEFPGERRTRAILIIHDGQIIAEKYAEGFDKNSRHMGWSMTKSVMNALVGILIRQEKLELNAPAPIEAWKNDSRSAITLHNLLQASSGLQWEENYGGPSDATNMLFKKRDAGEFASHAPLLHDPGTVFYYSSGTSNMISWIARKSVGDSVYHRLPYEQLFYPLGMYSMIVEPDAGGTFVASSFSYATARDWARFGMLFLNDGYWTTGRILPEGWVEYSTTPAKGAPQGEYGAQFWLNAGAPGNSINRKYPSVPTDLFWADGYEGQNVFVLPSENLVVVKLSQSTGNFLDDDKFLADIIRALPN